jgi:hypothetical protein
MKISIKFRRKITGGKSKKIKGLEKFIKPTCGYVRYKRVLLNNTMLNVKAKNASEKRKQKVLKNVLLPSVMLKDRVVSVVVCVLKWNNVLEVKKRQHQIQLMYPQMFTNESTETKVLDNLTNL